MGSTSLENFLLLLQAGIRLFLTACEHVAGLQDLLIKITVLSSQVQCPDELLLLLVRPGTKSKSAAQTWTSQRCGALQKLQEAGAPKAALIVGEPG